MSNPAIRRMMQQMFPHDAGHSGIPFHQTVRGAHFYDGQLPQLIKQLERVAAAMERLAALKERQER